MSAVRTVVCYLRTANPGTVGQRLLERQRAALQAACAFHGWTVTTWVEDLRQLGTTLDRRGLRDALALLADRQADALMVADAARLALDAEVANHLAALAGQQGWQILTLSPPFTAPLATTDENRCGCLGCGGAGQ